MPFTFTRYTMSHPVSQFQILEARSYNRDHRVHMYLVKISIFRKQSISKSSFQNSWFHSQIFFKEKKIIKIPLILNDRKSEWFHLELAQKMLNSIQCKYVQISWQQYKWPCYKFAYSFTWIYLSFMTWFITFVLFTICVVQ